MEFGYQVYSHDEVEDVKEGFSSYASAKMAARTAVSTLMRDHPNGNYSECVFSRHPSDGHWSAHNPSEKEMESALTTSKVEA